VGPPAPVPLGSLVLLHPPEPFGGRWQDDCLVASVRRYGIVQPLLVSPAAGEGFVVVDGERRYLTACALGLEAVPCLVWPLEAQDLERVRFDLADTHKRWPETDFDRWRRRKRAAS
jgi:ParB-like chromosome segregation protein Spo0J